jgi:hypothetical protein
VPVHAEPGKACKRDWLADFSPFATRDPQLINFFV